MGVLAVGDSLLDTERSWAHWLSLAMGLPLRTVAVGGSQSEDVVQRQLPLISDERYDVACLTVGSNDILFGWDAERFADNLGTIVEAARACAERVVVPTICLALASFPGSGSEFRRQARQANSIIEGSGALVFSGSDLRGPRLMSPDRIHPTTAGQLVLADRAAEVLGVTPLPSSLDEDTRALAWRSYYRVGAREAPRRLVKRMLGRPPFQRAP